MLSQMKNNLDINNMWQKMWTENCRQNACMWWNNSISYPCIHLEVIRKKPKSWIWKKVFLVFLTAKSN